MKFTAEVPENAEWDTGYRVRLHCVSRDRQGITVNFCEKRLFDCVRGRIIIKVEIGELLFSGGDRMKINLIQTILFVLISFVCCVQAADQEILTNESIISLTRANLQPSLIITFINKSACKFDLSQEELVRLKRERVKDEVIQAMFECDSGATNSEPPVPSKSTDVIGDLSEIKRAGIYFRSPETGKLVQIYPSVYSESKSGGMFLSRLTMGIHKVKSKAVLAGTNARYNIPSCVPEFYFCFEVTDTSLSSVSSSGGAATQSPATSPNEFVLVKTDVKNNGRELIVGQFNAWGAQSGTLSKYIRQFDFEEMTAGLFKVTPRSSLPNGEYAFFYGGASTVPTFGFSNVNIAGKVFDFGITCGRQGLQTPAENK